jgi:hypothetical protein
MKVPGFVIGQLVSFGLLAVTLTVAACGSSTTSLVEPSATKCEISATNDTTEIPASGGNGSVTVSTSRDCSWSASAEASWIKLSATSGQGPATVNYSVQANPVGTPRHGRLTVAQQAVDVAQAAAACRYDASPSTMNVDASEHRVSVSLTTLDGCAWSGRSDVAWISNGDPAQGVGSATVGLAVATNTTAARTGTVTIGNATVRIAQAGPAGPNPTPAPTPSPTPTPTPTPSPTPGPTCTYRLAQASRSVGRDPQDFTVGIAAPPSCAWNVSSDVPWITVADGRNGSGNGNFRLAVDGNSGSPRTGTVHAATEAFTVQQAGGACTYSIKPTNYNAGHGPDDITVDVTADSGCPWTATTAAPWVSIAAGASGSGNGTVRLLIPANGDAPRTAVVNIAGQTFTLRQEGPCTAKIKPRSYHAGRGPDDVQIDVSADGGCSWTASSTVSWVTVAAGASGTGDGTVRLLIAANSGPERSVTLIIAGQPFDLRQNGSDDR